MTIQHTTKIQVGLHTSATDFIDTSTNPAKFFHLTTPITPDPTYNREDRSNYQSCNGEPLPSDQVEKSPTFGQDLSIQLRGLSGGGTADGISASTLGLPLEDLFLSCFGTVTNGVGETTDGADAGTGTTLTLDASPSTAVGTALLVTGTTSGKAQAREVRAPSGVNINMCRGLTTDQSAAEDPDESTLCPASRTYTAGNQVPDRIHWFLDTENAGAWRRLISGAMANMVLTFERSKKAMVTLNGIVQTDWNPPSPASPVCVDPTGGLTIPVYDSPMWIGSDLYMATGLTVDLGLTIAPRFSDGGPNGSWGFVVERCLPKLSFELRAGSNTAPYEVTDAQLEAFRGNTQYDCLWQFGRAAGAACAIRVPALDFTSARRTANGGQEVITCEATATDASVVANAEGDAPLRFHIF